MPVMSMTVYRTQLSKNCKLENVGTVTSKFESTENKDWRRMNRKSKNCEKTTKENVVRMYEGTHKNGTKALFVVIWQRNSKT